MQKSWTFLSLSAILSVNGIVGYSVLASEPLYLAYPPENHKTASDKVFFIGSASPESQVTINGLVIPRSERGHFAPSFSLQIGENRFMIRQGEQIIERIITRLNPYPPLPQGLGFVPDSLLPKENIARFPNELICFEAIASPNAQVSVQLSNQTITLMPQTNTVQLPSNSAVLTDQNTAQKIGISKYQGCGQFSQVGNLGKPIFQVSLKGQTVRQPSTGAITIVNPNHLKVIEVISEAGVARTGPSTTYSRLTPLPKGTQAMVTGQQGDWLRLDYGGWIQAKETKLMEKKGLPNALVRGISSQVKEGRTEVNFPLSFPVPISIQQDDQTLTLTLYNTVAQTDTIYLSDDPFIKRLDWQQVTPNQVEYTFHFKTQQQWGYDVKYEGTNLKLSLRHPPQFSTNSLKGMSILLDPGHGGNESGAKGPTGYPEKAINLVISQLLEQELKRRGATVYLTRDTDTDVSLQDRVKQINQLKPTLALSIHYNALPDSGDAINTAGIGAFWYHPQAYHLANFLYQYLVENLNRPSYGVYWNNLALTRPHTAPTVLLELGFMINPTEFEWIVNPQEQQKLAKVLADGIEQWLQNQSTVSRNQ